MGRAKRKTKYFTFLLIPDNERATRSVKLSVVWIRFLVVFFTIVSVLVIFGATTYWKVAEVALDYNRILEENGTLKKSLDRVDALQAELERIKKSDQKLRNSLTGYVKMADSKNGEGEDLESLVAGALGARSTQAFYNSIPGIYPVDGFLTRRFESNTLLKDAHLGIDIAAAKGSPVKATADGQVIFSGWTIGQGNVIILKHKYDYYSYYKHNLRNFCRELEWVKKGEVIGLVGDTGQISSGPHVHFEIWKDSEPIDPLQYLGEGLKLSN